LRNCKRTRQIFISFEEGDQFRSFSLVKRMGAILACRASARGEWGQKRNRDRRFGAMQWRKGGRRHPADGQLGTRYQLPSTRGFASNDVADSAIGRFLFSKYGAALIFPRRS
jgi:hypothetical protein